MKGIVTALSATLALTLAAREVRAQAVQNIVLRNSFNPIGAGARGVGMGGAFIAVADDGTAATFNPAGLAQLRRPELALVGFSSSLSSTVDGASPAQWGENSAAHGAIDFVGLAVPFEARGRRLTFQLSYQRAVDLFGEGQAVVVDELAFTDLGIEEPGRVGVSVGVSPEQRGAHHNVSSALAFQVTDRLLLGAAFNYWMGDWTARGTRDVTLFATSPTVPRGSPQLSHIETTFEQKQSLRGFNLNAGFLLKYEKLSLGGVLRLPFNGEYTLDETSKSTVTQANGQRSAPTQGRLGVTSRLAWPRSAGLGAALRPVNGLTVAFDVSTAMWSRAAIEQLPAGALLTESPADSAAGQASGFVDRNFFDLLPQPLTRTSDSSQWRGGAEYLIVLSGVVVPVRAGLFRSTSPFSDAIEGESSDIRGFTAGTGLNFNNFVLDIAFERQETDVALVLRRLTRSEAASRPMEKASTDRIVASVIFRFSNDGGLGGFFRSLFAGSENEEEDSE